MTSNSDSSQCCYQFFDKTIALSLPDYLHSAWDLIYGNFRIPWNDRAIQLEVNVVSEERAVLRLGEEKRVISVSDAMVYLQDVVQNKLLSQTTSHYLFHGACWKYNDSGLIILAESGVGKSTLSLHHKENGGEVISDEIAAWNPDKRELCSFPRSLAVRPHSLDVCGVDHDYPRLFIDEEKAIVPLHPSSHEQAGLHVGGVIILEGERDAVAGAAHLLELSVASADERWKDILLKTYPGLVITQHPDDSEWWRCQAQQPIKASALHELLESEDAVLTGYHRGAYRSPDYTKDPTVEAIDASATAEAMLAYLINAQALTQAYSPVQIMGEIMGLLQGVSCCRCIPGEIQATVNGIKHFAIKDS